MVYPKSMNTFQWSFPMITTLKMGNPHSTWNMPDPGGTSCGGSTAEPLNLESSSGPRTAWTKWFSWSTLRYWFTCVTWLENHRLHSGCGSSSAHFPVTHYRSLSHLICEMPQNFVLHPCFFLMWVTGWTGPGPFCGITLESLETRVREPTCNLCKGPSSKGTCITISNHYQANIISNHYMYNHQHHQSVHELQLTHL